MPLALVLVFVRWHSTHLIALFIAGEAVVAIGLTIRFWGVSHIGGISRTRAARLGPLTRTGPYLLVRNPLYVGNFLMWIGFVLASQLLWMLPVAWIVFAVQYGAIGHGSRKRRWFGISAPRTPTTPAACHAGPYASLVSATRCARPASTAGAPSHSASVAG